MSRSKKRQQLYTLLMIFQGLTVFMIILLAVLIYANWPALKTELGFAVKKPVVTATATPTLAPSATPVPIVEAPHIIIDKIGADLPISWNVSADTTLDALNHGVAHLDGSAKLGEIGNLFITGHSSDYVWKQNPYAAAFALLPKLAVGDSITIKENGKSYVYKVAQTKIVQPDHVEIAKPTTSPILTLMTCYPIGTTKERYVIHASLVSSPEAPIASNQTTFTAPEIKFR